MTPTPNFLQQKGKTANAQQGVGTKKKPRRPMVTPASNRKKERKRFTYSRGT